MTDATATKTQDAYEKIVYQVLAGNVIEAIQLFNTLPQAQDRTEVLDRAAKDILSHVKHARDLANERVRELEHTPALDIPLSRARARVQDLERALDLAVTLVRNRAFDLESTLELARALELARGRDRDPALDRALNPLYQMSLFLTKSLEGNLSRREGEGSRITLGGVEKLTPHTLSHEVAPYLQAIWELYAIIGELSKTEVVEPTITSISQEAPFAVTLSGSVEEAISVITTLVSKWRKEHAMHIAILEETQKKAEIAKLQAEVTEFNYKSQSPENASKWSTVELELAREESRRLDSENEKHESRLYKAKIELGLHIIRQFAPQLPEAERLLYIQRLLKPLEVLGESPLEIEGAQD